MKSLQRKQVSSLLADILGFNGTASCSLGTCGLRYLLGEGSAEFVRICEVSAVPEIRETAEYI